MKMVEVYVKHRVRLADYILDEYGGRRIYEISDGSELCELLHDTVSVKDVF